MSLRPNNTVSGILLMLLHAAAMSVIYIIGKKLSHTLAPLQIAFLYKLSILLMIIPWCHFQEGGLAQALVTKRLGLHFARGFFSLAATVSFYNGLQYISAVDAAAITYLEHIIVVLIGVIYFQEKLTPAKLIFTFLGICGALLVINPKVAKFNVGYVYLFLALVFWALNNCSVKLLGRTESGRAQLFYVAFFSTMLSFPFALQYDWSNFHLTELQYVSVTCVFHLIHVISFFKAFKFADISTVMPFDYARLIFTGLLGYFFLHEMPSTESLAGYIVIALGGIYLVIDEASRQQKAPAGQRQQSAKSD